MPQLLITLLLIAIGWFLLIRPQQARVRAQQAMVAALQVGDRVITAGGIHGTITALADDTLRLEVAPGVELTLARAAVGRRVTDGPASAAGAPADAGHAAGAPTGDAGTTGPRGTGSPTNDDQNHEVEDEVDPQPTGPEDGPTDGGPA